MKEKELYKEILKQHLTLPTEFSAEEIVQKKEKKNTGYVKSGFLKYAAAAAAVVLAIGAGVWVFRSSNKLETDTADDIRTSPSAAVTDTSSSYPDILDSLAAEKPPYENKQELFKKVFENMAANRSGYDLRVLGYEGTDEVGTLFFNGRKILETLIASPQGADDCIEALVNSFGQATPEYIGCRKAGVEGRGELSEDDFSKLFCCFISTVTVTSHEILDEIPDTVAVTAINSDVYICLYDTKTSYNDPGYGYEYYYRIPMNEENGAAEFEEFYYNKFVDAEDLYQMKVISPAYGADDIEFSRMKDQQLIAEIPFGGKPTIGFTVDVNDNKPKIKVDSIQFESDEVLKDVKVTVELYSEDSDAPAPLVTAFSPYLSNEFSFNNYLTERGYDSVGGARVRIQFDTDKHSIPKTGSYDEYAYDCTVSIGTVNR